MPRPFLPGYGFLSERRFCRARVEKSGFQFIGPTPENIRTMGDRCVSQAGHDQGRACPVFRVPTANCRTIPYRIRHVPRRWATRSSSRRRAAGRARRARGARGPPWSARCSVQGRSGARVWKSGGLRGKFLQARAISDPDHTGRPSTAMPWPPAARRRLLHATPPPEGDRGGTGAGIPASAHRSRIGDRCVAACKENRLPGQPARSSFWYENGEFYFIE